jgi:hypothetical protein
MGHTRGRVTEIRLDAGRQMEAFIACPAGSIPQAGQYLLASDISDPDVALGTPLFLAQKSMHGFWTVPPIPVSWRPGTDLDLVGPTGFGFDLPREVQRLGLVALGETAARLMPLVESTSQLHRGVTLFTDLPLPTLPTSLEAYPLASLTDALDWPDFLAIDLQLERLSELRSVLGLSDEVRLAFPAQVLVTSPMPCAGLAKCGVCAVPARRGWKFICEDGPVFDLDTLKW